MAATADAINQTTFEEDRKILQAISEGNVEALHQFKLDPNKQYQDAEGNKASVLHWAAKAKQPRFIQTKVMRYLVARYARFHNRNADNMTHPNLVEEFIYSRNAYDGKSPIDWAVEAKALNSVIILFSFRIGVADSKKATPLERAIALDHVEACKLMSADEKDLSIGKRKAISILHMAIRYGSGKVFQAFKGENENECNKKIIKEDENKWTVLHYAVICGQVPILKIIQTSLAKEDWKKLLDKRDFLKKTPFEIAVEKGKEDVIRYLCKEGGVDPRTFPKTIKISENMKAILPKMEKLYDAYKRKVNRVSQMEPFSQLHSSHSAPVLEEYREDVTCTVSFAEVGLSDYEELLVRSLFYGEDDISIEKCFDNEELSFDEEENSIIRNPSDDAMAVECLDEYFCGGSQSDIEESSNKAPRYLDKLPGPTVDGLTFLGYSYSSSSKEYNSKTQNKSHQPLFGGHCYFCSGKKRTIDHEISGNAPKKLRID